MNVELINHQTGESTNITDYILPLEIIKGDGSGEALPPFDATVERVWEPPNPHVTFTIDTTVLSRALDGFGAASMDACKAAMGIAGASPWAREIAEAAARNAELMEKAQFLTSKTANEIRVLAAQSPLCFADFVATLQNPPGGTPAPNLSLTPPPTKQPATIVTRYGIDFCAICSLMVAYCRCGTTPATSAANDGDESGLARRIVECKGR